MKKMLFIIFACVASLAEAQTTRYVTDQLEITAHDFL